MKKKTLAGIAFCMGAGASAYASNNVDVQALELLKENRISYAEYEKLTVHPRDTGTWSSGGLDAGTWSSGGVDADTWSSGGIDAGTWSSGGLDSSTWSSGGVDGGDAAHPENVNEDKMPAPQISKNASDQK